VSISRPRTMPGSSKAPAARSELLSHNLARVTDSSLLDRSIAAARDALVATQHAQGYWLFELEADCTIPSEYILMMHFLEEIDAPLRQKSLPTCAPTRPSTAAGPSTTMATSI
jgi:Squalene-hopene cyclase N-terminal domain